MSASTDGSKFIYLLNAMEVAAQADDPSREGYAEKRRAVLDYVAGLERSDGPQYEPCGFIWEDAAGTTFHEEAPKSPMFKSTEVFKRTDATREDK